MELLNSSYGQNDSISDYNYNDSTLITMCEMEEYRKTTAVCYAIIFCLSFVGNGFLLCSLTCHEDLKRATNLFIFCLALFDALFTLTLPFWCVDFLHHWVFGDAACKIMIGAYFMGIYGSLILLTAMTLDRFFMVVVRWDWLTGSRRLQCSRAACACAWIISLIASLRDSLASKAEQHIDMYTCTSTHTDDDHAGYYTQLILLFLLPFMLIVFCYTKILITLMSTTSRQKHRTVIMVLCIIIAFFICWGPYHIVMVLTSLYDPCEYERLHLAFVVCRILAFSHCCMNPVLYFLRWKFRRFVSRFLFCYPEFGGMERTRGPTEPSDSRIHPYTNDL